MDINISYDSSVANAPSWFQTAVSYAVNALDTLITTPISITVDFGWGEENNNAIQAGATASSQSAGNYFDYATLLQALGSHATSALYQTAMANLSAGDPTNGGRFFVSNAEQKALGLMSSTASGVDGYVGLNALLPWSTNPGGSVAVGTYDPVGAIEHELTEIMGRIGLLGAVAGPGVYGPMDLFRYSSPGVRDLTPGPGYFSINGQDMLLPFNNPLNGGDASDWSSSVSGDSFGNAYAGTTGALSSTDLSVLDVLGYTLSPNGLGTSTTSSGGGTTPPDHGGKAFVFQAHPGAVTVSTFVATGSNHDVISLSSSAFSSIAAVLHNTRMVGHDAVITIDAHDSITLSNVALATLRTHHADVQLHA